MINSIKKKIVLGTAQFGNNYGVTNNNILIFDEVKKILLKAKAFGINTLDTSEDYQNYDLLRKTKIKKFKIIAKFALNQNKNIENYYVVNNIVSSYLKKLNIQVLEGLLYRNPLILLEKKKYWEFAQNLKRDNIVNKIGYTIYSPNELDRLFYKYKPDFVQLPYNIFDRRFEVTGWINKLYEEDIEIHIRSIFLQGLLLANISKIPKKFLKYKKTFNLYEEWLCSKNINKLVATLSLFENDNRINKIIVGVQTKNELVNLYNTKPKPLQYPEWMNKINKNLINPKHWS